VWTIGKGIAFKTVNHAVGLDWQWHNLRTLTPVSYSLFKVRFFRANFVLINVEAPECGENEEDLEARNKGRRSNIAQSY